jgi:hypothetical protein
MFDVTFEALLQIDVPDGSERYSTRHKAQIITCNYSMNGVGLVMLDLDNLWKLERRIE